MAAEITALLNSDGEVDDAAPLVVDASLAGWQQQDPNAGASAFQAIDLGSDSGEEDSYPVRRPASDAGTLSADGAAPGASPPGNNGGGNGSSDGDGLASSDIRSDSSSSSSEAHAGASGHEPVVGVGHAALAGGGADVGLDLCAAASPAQTPVGEQQAAAAGALGNFDSSCSGQESPLAMRGRHEQQQAASAPAVARGEEMREGRLKGGNRHDGAGDDAEAKAESKAKDEDGVSYIAGVTEVSNVDEDALASGAIAPASPASERPQGGVVVAAPTPAAAAAGGIAIAMVMRDNVAGGDSKSVESWIKSGGPASAPASSQPATPLSAVDSVETIIDALPPGFVKCPGCPMVYELVPNEDAARGGGGSVATQELPKGANLSRRSAMRHNGRHRFRCPSCSTCFCGSCRAVPYHIGFDCDGWTAHQAKPKCTFCSDAAEESGVEAGDVDAAVGEKGDKAEEAGLQPPPCCGGEECRERANEGCRKKLPCGHPCRGPRAMECLPCIETGCPSAEVDGDDYCNVCWTEPLLSAPCVKLECGHFVHVSCGREQLKRGRPTARLTFGFMSCPVCRADKVLATHPHLSKCEGIPEQLTLAHQVEELAIQRLRADELPPLQRSSLESLQAGMRRRMAAIARQQQIHGWRARGGAFPLQIPYPRMHGYQPQMRVGGAAAGVGAGGAGGARAHPMHPRPLLQGAAPGDWQPLAGMGIDWGKPPYVMPPAPYAQNRVAAAGAGRGTVARGAAAAGGQGGPGGAQQRPVSKEEHLDRKRKMLIAQADIAMKRAAVLGARIPGARLARGLVADSPVANGPSQFVRDRLEQQLEKGKAVLEERRRVRRDARKELDDFPLPDGFPYRSRPSQLAAGAGASGAAVDADKEENVQDDAVQPQRRLRRSGNGVPDLKPDAGDVAAPASVPNHDPRIRRFPPDDQHIQPELLDTDVGDGGDDNKAMGVWGWGRAVNRFVGGEAAAAAAEQPSEELNMSRRAHKGACFSDRAKNAAICDSGAHEMNDCNGRGTGQPRLKGIDLEPAATAPGAHADRDRGQSGDMAGDNGLANDFLGVLPRRLRSLGSLSGRPRRKLGEEGIKGGGHMSRAAAAAAAGRIEIDDDDNDDDDVVCLGEGDGGFAFPSSGWNRRQKRRLCVGVSFAGVKKKSQDDGDDTPPAAVVDEDNEKAERSHAVKRPRGAGSAAKAVDNPEPASKRGHLGRGRSGMGRWRRELNDGWLALDRAAARVEAGARAVAGFAGRKEQGEKDAPGAAADALVAVAGAGGAGSIGVDSLAENYRPGRVAWSENARVAAAATAAAAASPAAAGAAPGAAGLKGAVPRGASGVGIDNPPQSLPVPNAAAAPKEGKGVEGGSAAGDVASPAIEQTNEERAEMAARALKKYSYYQCHSCRKPYFGGLVSCEPAAPLAAEGGAGGAAGGGAAREAEAGERALADIKPQELLCGKCSAGSGGANCSEHGQEFMEHKCYWCCQKVASYFCGGVMHFCDVCHLHGFAARLKPCLGGARCLFGGKHPEKAKNGENEFVLGCGICRPKPEEAEEAPGGASG